jgi:hypothetical protein
MLDLRDVAFIRSSNNALRFLAYPKSGNAGDICIRDQQASRSLKTCSGLC